MQAQLLRNETEEKDKKTVETIVNLHSLAIKSLEKYKNVIGSNFEQKIFTAFWHNEHGDHSKVRPISFIPTIKETKDKFLLNCNFEFYIVKLNLKYRAICSFGYDELQEIYVLDIYDICSVDDLHKDINRIIKAIVKED